MEKSVEKTLLVGNTSFTIRDGEILSVSREQTHYTKENGEFQGAINYAFVMATSNHKNSLLSLLDLLDTSKDPYAYKAVMVLNECQLTDSLSKAVNTALHKKAESSVLS